MATGFRKSLMGFHTGDVLNYIESVHRAHAEKEETLTRETDELRGSLERLKKEYDALAAEKEQTDSKLREYNEKYEEINRLSENIGKLYLVAQANAQAIMKNSAELNEKAAAEAERNLSSIENAQQSLTAIKQELLDTTSAFSGKVSELIASLNDTRGRIAEVNADSEQHAAEFSAVYETLAR